MKKLLITALACASLISITGVDAFAVENSNSKIMSSSDIAATKNMSIKTTLKAKATAYAGDTITSTGTTPKWGTIAVDPKVIPYGTKVYIPQFDKIFVAEDCGSAIKGNRIDIFMDTEAHCNEWGVKNIEIKILN